MTSDDFNDSMEDESTITRALQLAEWLDIPTIGQVPPQFDPDELDEFCDLGAY